jgi:glycosyltransferase involved in cell wall biosynthesis
MKIIFSTDNLIRAGKERQFCLLLSSLPDNFQTFIFAKRLDKFNNYLSEYGIPENTVLYYRNLSDYKNLILNIKPDLIYSWDLKSSIYNLFLYKKYNYKFINGSVRHGIRLIRFSHLLRSIILWMSPYIIANSYSGLKANNLKPGKNKFVLYNGLNNLNTRIISKQEKEKNRRELFPDFRNDDIIYVSIANFVPYKDYSTILYALNSIKKSVRFKYIIIGEGPLRNDIEKIIKLYNLNDRIFLTGRITDVAKYLMISDIFLHSSKGEGISNAILEAMHCGLPVISSDVGGVKETVYKPFSFLFPYGDKKILTELLLKSRDLINIFNKDDPEYKKHLEKFSRENMIDNFIRIIGNIYKNTHVCN